MSRFISISLTMLILLASIGCSKAPDAEIQSGQNALAAARDAEAEEYAPEAYRAASEALTDALAAKQEQDSKFTLFRSYGGSKDMLARAKALADSAAAAALAEKETLAIEVADLIADARTALDNATATLATAPKGKGSAADLELIRSDIAGAATLLEEAAIDLETGRYRIAEGKAQSIIDKANAIIAEIAAASARKAGR